MAESFYYSKATRGNIEVELLANGKPVECGAKYMVECKLVPARPTLTTTAGAADRSWFAG